MPVIFRYKGFRFFFNIPTGNPLELVHVHVRLGNAMAKFWLHPSVSMADSHGFDAPTLNELARVIEQNRDVVERSWHEYFG